MGHVYSTEFYDYINGGARASAQVIIPIMQRGLPIGSVLDVGAGVGAWAAEWLASGATEVVAVDGCYASGNALLVPQKCFIAHDLAQPLNLERQFDLVQSLEVAEHIAPDRADCFVDTLVTHGDVILFSAAVPNQGGEHHVNEQPPEYWRRKFAARGYSAFDWLRPQLSGSNEVEPWYRYNSLIYANAVGQQRLSEGVLATRVADADSIEMRGSVGWRVRLGVVGLMPAKLVNRVAVAKARRKARAARQCAL